METGENPKNIYKKAISHKKVSKVFSFLHSEKEQSITTCPKEYLLYKYNIGSTNITLPVNERGGRQCEHPSPSKVNSTTS
jgi:hypothetical protein